MLKDSEKFVLIDGIHTIESGDKSEPFLMSYFLLASELPNEVF